MDGSILMMVSSIEIVKSRRKTKKGNEVEVVDEYGEIEVPLESLLNYLIANLYVAEAQQDNDKVTRLSNLISAIRRQCSIYAMFILERPAIEIWSVLRVKVIRNYSKRINISFMRSS